MRINGTLWTEQDMVVSTHTKEELRVIVQGLASQTIKNMLDQREGTNSILTRVLKEEHLKRLSIN